MTSKTSVETPGSPEAEALPADRPSNRMLRTWAKRIRNGDAVTIPVFVGGAWSLQILRGHKRILQLSLTRKEGESL